jgi:hypothetical protein
MVNSLLNFHAYDLRDDSLSLYLDQNMFATSEAYLIESQISEPHH